MKGQTPLNGLGDCFEVAAHQVIEDKTLTLVHALVVGQEGGNATPGERHWHAWVEYAHELTFPDGRKVGLPTVVDKSNGNDVRMPQALYYKIGGIETTHRYTAAEAMSLMLEHEHYGPWEAACTWCGMPEETH